MKAFFDAFMSGRIALATKAQESLSDAERFALCLFMTTDRYRCGFGARIGHG